MNIAFDAKRLYNNFTGLGNYSRTLVSNLAQTFPEHQYQLFTPKVKTNEETLPFLNSKKLKTILPNNQNKAYWRTFSIKKDLAKHHADIYHGLSHEIPFGLHKTDIKSVVSIHDLIIKRYPHYFPFIDRNIYDLKFKYACQNADAIIAISESTKRDIIEFYGIDAEKIKVIYQTCHERFKQKIAAEQLQKIAHKYQLPKHFLLYVGSIIPRKNLNEIIKALATLPKDLQLPLVVIGSGKKYKQEVLQTIKKLQLEDKILFLKIDFDDLAAIYQLAHLLIYPSDYEGFGIPILEALHSNIPVLTANNSSLAEAGGKGAFYIEKITTERLSDAMIQLISDKDLREKLVQNGQKHCQKFDSRLLSQQLMELYQGLG